MPYQYMMERMYKREGTYEWAVFAWQDIMYEANSPKMVVKNKNVKPIVSGLSRLQAVEYIWKRVQNEFSKRTTLVEDERKIVIDMTGIDELEPLADAMEYACDLIVNENVFDNYNPYYDEGWELESLPVEVHMVGDPGKYKERDCESLSMEAEGGLFPSRNTITISCVGGHYITAEPYVTEETVEEGVFIVTLQMTETY